MCGIFGYVGQRDATPLIMDGLARLEYRGYDSTGLAVIDGEGQLRVLKAAGKLQILAALVANQPVAGTGGVGHTRWATHGGPTDENAHPHTDATNSIVAVHNGIVENYLELKENLIAKGHLFTSVTDSEVIPHLVQERLSEGHPFAEAVRLAASELRGAHAIACLHTGDPDTLVALRVGNAGGISVGYGDGEMFLASDLPALIPLTRSIAYLAPGEMAVIRPNGCTYQTLDGKPTERKPKTVAASTESVAKGGFPHFMLKEIMEQPEAAMNALRGRLAFNPESLTLDEVPFSQAEVQEFRRVVFVAMGSSYNAAQVGARLTELLARLPATAENASEFRYRQPVLGPDTLVVAVGQSGETADTLEALHQAINEGARTLTICNVEGSQATHVAEGTVLMHAGPEVGVAASKTFTNSLVCLYMLAVHLGAQRGVLDEMAIAGHVETLAQVPALLGRALEVNDAAAKLAVHYAQFERFLFIGRGLLEPLAKEGALKLKEISYLHAEGLAAAEMKHGPIALVDPKTPVVALALQDSLYQKMLGNISEVRARNGRVLAIATEGDERIVAHADNVLWVPSCPPALAPMIAAVPLQLFAYHTAVQCGTDVDQPRNLAKSVTVE